MALGTDTKIELHKVVSFEDLNWECAQERIKARTQRTEEETEALIKSFVAQFFSSLRGRWLKPGKLSESESLVTAALCECHGCDDISVEKRSRLALGIDVFPIHQSLRFKVRQASGTGSTTSSLSSGVVRIGTKRFGITIHNYDKLLFVFAISIIAGGVFYSIAILLMVYGLAIFQQFISDPGGITRLATERAEIFLGLLSFLVGLAALLGTLVKRMLRRFKR